ncbi:MFS transporter, FHS family, L-fucose permease [Terriglobus roseus]|uniref:MFS transporter, FHS family, L-fucose permease n=1 Tax=Terriglobus roseus TaxID=392734 RepID=A0A1H4SCT7_9BACT|nr:MFS transporter, FHS family, L-fucose permease [Terriglobus roseus]
MNTNPSFDPTEGRLQSASASLLPKSGLIPFALVTALFFLWGMSNNLTDVLVQQFKKSFDLSPLQAQLVQTAVFFGYFCMALPAALVTKRHGYKRGILIGLGLFGTGMLLFWPAAVIGRYSLMLFALYVVGCGSAVLETTANPFIAQSGPPESSERRLNLAQSFNPPGTICGVLVGTYFIFSGVELTPAQVLALQQHGQYTHYLHSELMRVVPPYVTLGCVVLALAGVIAFARFNTTLRQNAGAPPEHLGRQIVQILRTPQVLAAVAAQFCYCGAQVSTWSAFIPYTKQYAATSERTAALFLTGNLVAFAAGRIFSTSLMRRFRPVRMMTAYALVNILVLGFAVLRPGLPGAIALVVTSFFMSVMYPTIFSIGIKGLGAKTELASSLLVMAVVGAAVIPPLLGLVARATRSYALGYAPVLACYAVVAVFGWLHSGAPVKASD